MISVPACCFVAAAFLSSGPLVLRFNRSPLRQSRRSLTTMASTRVGGGDGMIVDAPSGSVDSSVIFLHGLGDSARGWSDAFPLAGLPNTHYVLPSAETMSVSINMGLKMVCCRRVQFLHFRLNYPV